MACEWPEARLGSVADLQTGFPFRSEHYTDDPCAPRLIRGDNVVQGAFRWDGVKRWPQHLTADLDSYWLREDDIILAMDRPWIDAGLKYATIRRSDLPALLVQRVARLRGTASVDTRFLRYVIGSRQFTNYILAVQTGTAVPHISGSQIRQFTFRLPPVHAQKAIADILGSLDDKIDLNRRTNETLEAMARAIFKSWFVDFDPVIAKSRGRQPAGMDAETAKLFPSEFQDSEIGPVPRGWRVGTVGDLVSLRRDTLTPALYPDEIFEHYSIPAFDEGRVPKAELGSTIMSNKFVVPDGCVLLSKLNPRIPRVWAAHTKGRRRALCSTEFLVCLTQNGISREFLFLLFNSVEFCDRFATYVTGTSGSHQRVKPESLLNIELVIPPETVIGAFACVTRPVLAATMSSGVQSCGLAEARDALLPRLLSGGLQVLTEGVRR